jgi:hypothetical protein
MVTRSPWLTTNNRANSSAPAPPLRFPALFYRYAEITWTYYLPVMASYICSSRFTPQSGQLSIVGWSFKAARPFAQEMIYSKRDV